MSAIPLLPLSARPVFARKLLAVWRLHHLDRGEKVVIWVYPGEWPLDEPREVKGAEVREDAIVTYEGGVFVMGRVRDSWRWAFNMAVDYTADMSVDDLAVVTFFGAVPDEGDMRVWMHPSPQTGEVPMWEVARRP